MQKVMQGTVHGRTIELESDPEVEEGSTVEIVMRVTHVPGTSSDTTQSAAGMMSRHWTEEDDKILEEIYQDRKRDGRV